MYCTLFFESDVPPGETREVRPARAVVGGLEGGEQLARAIAIADVGLFRGHDLVVDASDLVVEQIRCGWWPQMSAPLPAIRFRAKEVRFDGCVACDVVFLVRNASSEPRAFRAQVGGPGQYGEGV